MDVLDGYEAVGLVYFGWLKSVLHRRWVHGIGVEDLIMYNSGHRGLFTPYSEQSLAIGWCLGFLLLKFTVTCNLETAGPMYTSDIPKTELNKKQYPGSTAFSNPF